MSIPGLDLIDTAAERTGLTVALLVGVVALGWVVRRWAKRSLGHRDDRIVNVIVGGAWFVSTLAATALLVMLWDAEPWVERVSRAVPGNKWEIATNATFTLVLAAVVYVSTGLVRNLIHEFTEHHEEITRHQAEVIYRVLQVAAYAVGLVVVLGAWNVNLGGLLVGAGFLGIVLGLAARQTLGALLAGFVLMFSRPFEIGDWVRIGDNEGIVTDITVVNTRLQTFDGEYVVLPNDLVSTNEIVNRTRKGRLRIEVDVGVDYAADLDRAREVAREAMGDVDDILSVPQPDVVYREFGSSAVVLGLRFWIDNPSARRRWRAQTAVIGAVKAAFDDAGVKIPFPQRELSGRPEAGGFRVAETERPEPRGEEAAADDDD